MRNYKLSESNERETPPHQNLQDGEKTIHKGIFVILKRAENIFVLRNQKNNKVTGRKELFKRPKLVEIKKTKNNKSFINLIKKKNIK